MRTSSPDPCGACVICSCCHHYTVDVTGYDLWVIANGLQMSPAQFLVARPQESPDLHGFLLDGSGQTYDLFLDKAPAQTDEKPCIFLLGFPSGIWRCGIYALRPLLCRCYPAHLTGNAVERREDALCPPERWRNGILSHPSWYENLLRMQVENDIYRVAVAQWNYYVRQTAVLDTISLATYYTFLLTFYSRLEPVRASLETSEWLAMCAVWAPYYRRFSSPVLYPKEDMAPWSAVTQAILTSAHSSLPTEPL